MKTKLFVVMTAMLFLTIGCAQTNFFGVEEYMQTPIPPEFAQTEALVNKAEASRGAKYCPVKVTQAKN